MEELSTLREQLALVSSELTNVLVQLSRLWAKHSELQARMLSVLAQARIRARVPGRMTETELAILERIESALKQDSSGRFTSELERILEV